MDQPHGDISRREQKEVKIPLSTLGFFLTDVCDGVPRGRGEEMGKKENKQRKEVAEIVDTGNKQS